MKTRDRIHAELRRRIPAGNSVPPLTAIETLICEALDHQEARISVAHTKIHSLIEREQCE